MLPIPQGRYPRSGPLSFMYRRSETHYHRGVDIAAPIGTPVFAVEGGRVTHTVDRDLQRPGFRGYGKVVVIEGGSHVYYLYGHLDRVDVQPGDLVETGQTIGTVGITAYRAGEPNSNLRNRAPHLHLEASATPYPKHPEAERLDPVAALEQSPPAPGPRPAPGGGGGAAAVALFQVALVLVARRR